MQIHNRQYKHNVPNRFNHRDLHGNRKFTVCQKIASYQINYKYKKIKDKYKYNVAHPCKNRDLHGISQISCLPEDWLISHIGARRDSIFLGKISEDEEKYASYFFLPDCTNANIFLIK